MPITLSWSRSTAPIPVTLIDPATTAGQQPVGQTGWTLAMSEEFNGSITVTDATNGYVTFRPGGPTWATWYPDWAMFASQVGGNHTNTDQEAYYATSKVTLDGAGSMVLACDKQTTVTGLDYTAGMIQSLPSYTYQYGYVEAKLKISAQSVNGHWPAWWASASTTNMWPPEIDFFEYFWSAANYESHIYMPSPGVEFDDTTNNGGDLTAFHTFGCKWTSSAVQFYLDGTLMASAGASSIPASPLYLILNNGARTPANPTASPMPTVTVDYIRAWQ